MTRDARAKYLCHECGSLLVAQRGHSRLWCFRCRRWRLVPTHPALIV